MIMVEDGERGSEVQQINPDDPDGWPTLARLLPLCTCTIFVTVFLPQIMCNPIKRRALTG